MRLPSPRRPISRKRPRASIGRVPAGFSLRSAHPVVRAPACSSREGARTNPSRQRPSTHSVKAPVAPQPLHTRLARTPQMPICSVPWRSRNARTNTEQPCHPIPSCSATFLTRGIGQALPHTECDGRESCLTSTSCGVQLNADTPCGTPWTTATLHGVPKPKHPTTLKYVQVPPTGGQEVSPRVFRGSPQVGRRGLRRASHKRWWKDAALTRAVSAGGAAGGGGSAAGGTTILPARGAGWASSSARCARGGPASAPWWRSLPLPRAPRSGRFGS
ncbi:hypothetical protein BH11MYX4_BH11MYX4_39200 [soil metagenome]